MIVFYSFVIKKVLDWKGKLLRRLKLSVQPTLSSIMWTMKAQTVYGTVIKAVDNNARIMLYWYMCVIQQMVFRMMAIQLKYIITITLVWWSLTRVCLCLESCLPLLACYLILFTEQTSEHNIDCISYRNQCTLI